MRRTDRWRLDLSRLQGILGDDAFLYVNYPFCSKLCGFCIYKLHRYSDAASTRFLSDLEMEFDIRRRGRVLASLWVRSVWKCD